MAGLYALRAQSACIISGAKLRKERKRGVGRLGFPMEKQRLKLGFPQIFLHDD